MTKKKIDWDRVYSLVSRIGSTGEPGSSTRKGWLYQPMADLFPEFRGVDIHKKAAVRLDFKNVMSDLAADLHKASMLWDIGCSTGYYLGMISRMDGAPMCAGVERDPTARAIAKELGYTVFSNDFLCIQEDIPNQVILMMNVHMWLDLAEEDDLWMDSIHKLKDSVLYFQTASQQSSGMRRVPWLKNEDDERMFLEQMFPSVEKLAETPKHGGRRTLWRCATATDPMFR